MIADLSVNHVERHVLLNGHVIERTEHDYGTDLTLVTFADDGEVENGQILLQLKATDELVILRDEQTIAFPLDRADLELWLREPMPYILIVYDAQEDKAYWLYIQEYFENRADAGLDLVGRSITVHLSKTNVVNEDAIRTFVRYKADVLRQTERIVRHNAHVNDQV